MRTNGRFPRPMGRCPPTSSIRSPWPRRVRASLLPSGAPSARERRPARRGIREAARRDVYRRSAPLEAYTWENAEALISIEAPENTRELGSLSEERLALVQSAWRPIVERLLSNEMKWVGCQFPTPALAQDAGMSLTDFSDFLYGACLLDWDAERERMSRYAELFDAAEEVRIVGTDTDLRLSLAGRGTVVDAGGSNMPGGEFYCCPVEDSAEGT